MLCVWSLYDHSFETRVDFTRSVIAVVVNYYGLTSLPSALLIPGRFGFHGGMLTSSNGNVRYWSFVRGIHRSQVNSPRKGQWCAALTFPMICAWIKDWASSREAGDLRRPRAHCGVIIIVGGGVIALCSELQRQSISQQLDFKLIAIFIDVILFTDKIKIHISFRHNLHSVWQLIIKLYSKSW